MVRTKKQESMSDNTKTIITAILLVYFFPVGFILMLFWTNWPKWVKWLISAPIIVSALSILIAGVLVAIDPISKIKKEQKTLCTQQCGGDIENTVCIATCMNKYKYSIGEKYLPIKFREARQRARESMRKSDVRQIQLALEFYRSDTGTYPSLGTNAGDFPSTCGNPLTNSTDTTIYMKKTPCDPSTGDAYTYSTPNNNSYSIIACLENINDPQLDTPKTNCSGSSTTWQYTIQNLR